MRFFLDDLPVLFPYDYIYPEQYAYMRDIKRALDAKGHCLLEMPSGTGKTVSLLSLIVAYQQFYPEKRKLVYCSRTVPEINKALAELKRLMEYRQSHGMKEHFLGIGLTSRRNLCVHPQVSKEQRVNEVDARCRSLTAPWVREAAHAEGARDVPLCDFFESLENADSNATIPAGVYTLDELKDYHYILDPKIAELVSRELSKDSIVVFDEAHNIDNVCTESLSVDLTRGILDASARSVAVLDEKIEQ
ncbi:hypothetical protein HK405_013268 [Cladochytrium tenue]|nr:hypothetical protein HK405_013268 [Cladochytrium tenue]